MGQVIICQSPFRKRAKSLSARGLNEVVAPINVLHVAASVRLSSPLLETTNRHLLTKPEPFLIAVTAAKRMLLFHARAHVRSRDLSKSPARRCRALGVAFGRHIHALSQNLE